MAVGEDNPSLEGDEHGSDTLRRFAYQAKVIFPYVLRCALDGDEVAVIPEHLEDCFLERSSSSSYLQIKSRNTSRGGWTLGELLAPGGALRSLFRAYRLAPNAGATFEAHLEQSLSRSNIAALLKTPEGRKNAKLVEQVAKGLSITKREASAFLKACRVKEALPARDAIDAVNLRLLQDCAPDWQYRKVLRTYERVLEVIWKAMQAEPIGVEWPAYTSLQESADEAARKRYLAKRLDRARCKEIFGDLGGNVTSLLTRELDSTLPPPSNLERKLLEGGATREVVNHAKELRARAVVVEIQRMAGAEHSVKPFSVEDPALYAIQKKLEWHAVAANSKHAKTTDPANLIWSELLTELPKLGAFLDPDSIFGQDGYLILGELCELSDQCVTRWGGKGA